MKKRIVSLTAIIFVLLFIFSIPSYASIVEHGNKEKVVNLDSFNILRATYDDKNLYEEICNSVGSIIENGYLTVEMLGEFDSREYTILEEQEYTNGYLTRLTYTFDGFNFYEATFDSNFDADILTEEDFNIAIEYDVYDKVFHKYNTDYIIKKDGELITESSMIHTINDYSFCYLYGLTYTYNPTYVNNDLHIVMSYLNKKPMDELLEGLTILDKTNTEYEIIDNSYDYINSSIGEYSFIIVVWDSYSNVTVQKVYVDIVDLTAPKIEQIKSTTFSYEDDVTEEDILDCFTFDDLDIDISIDMNNYLNNIGIVGEYPATITATDHSSYHNQSSLDFIIKIEDKISPVLAMPSGIHLDYNTSRSIDDIKSLISANDLYDGNVTSSIEIIDLDDYQNNYDTIGVYRFNVKAIDNSNNETEAIFYIYVEDHTAPLLSIDKYIIITERYRPITKEQILDLFNELGYNLDGTDIESECFSLDSLDGEYDLELSLNDGTIEYDIITTEKNNAISFEIPKDNSKEVNVTLIVAISISGLLLSSVLVMSIIVYKKRH